MLNTERKNSEIKPPKRLIDSAGVEWEWCPNCFKLGRVVKIGRQLPLFGAINHGKRCTGD